MKKRLFANLIMVAIILVIMAAGILTVGHIQGWFDTPSEDQAVLTDIRGVLYLSRDGVSYPVSSDTSLRPGDQLSANAGTTAVIRIGDSYLTLGEKAILEIGDPAAEQFSITVSGGELFTYAVSPVTLRFDGQEVSVTDTVAALSVRSGAQSISVYAGSVTSGTHTASEGQLMEWVSGTVSISPLQINSLNNFNIAQLRSANQLKTLYFTVADLDQLIADRNQALEDLLNVPTLPMGTQDSTENGADETLSDESESGNHPETSAPDVTGPTETLPDPTEQSGSTQPEYENSTTADTTPTAPPFSGEATNPEATTHPEDATHPEDTTHPVDTTHPEDTTAPETKPAQTIPDTTATPTTEAKTDSATEENRSCIISIRCDTILNNMNSLDPSKVEFVPSDGMILSPVRAPFTEGETVFDVLRRVCDTLGIQLEYSWTPLYDSYYVEGINNLYEFDCGELSGWMYKVNEWFPNYGCSSYTLEDGDVIEWCYTCNNLGDDVGAPPYSDSTE